MAKCWEQRGCDEEMQADCPHPRRVHGQLPTKCAFAMCDRPTLRADDRSRAHLLRLIVDRSAAIKEVCLFCEFFLTHGPRLVAVTEDQEPAEEF